MGSVIHYLGIAVGLAILAVALAIAIPGTLSNQFLTWFCETANAVSGDPSTASPEAKSKKKCQTPAAP
jgi:hypothetical protein